MIMPLRSADLYLRYGRLDTKCLGEFTLLFSSGGDPISDTYKLQTPSIPAVELISHSSPSEGNFISGVTNLA